MATFSWLNKNKSLAAQQPFETDAMKAAKAHMDLLQQQQSNAKNTGMPISPLPSDPSVSLMAKAANLANSQSSSADATTQGVKGASIDDAMKRRDPRQMNQITKAGDLGAVVQGGDIKLPSPKPDPKRNVGAPANEGETQLTDQQKAELAARVSQASNQLSGTNQLAANAINNIKTDQPVPPVDQSGNGEVQDISDLNNMDEQYQKELEATQQAQAAATAKAVLGANAKAGLYGMAGSGALTAQEGDLRNVGARNEAQNIADLSSKYRDDQIKKEQVAIQQQQADQEKSAFDIAMLQLEDELGIDLNKDGNVGTQNISGDQAKSDKINDNISQTAGSMGGTGTASDPYGGMGGASTGKVAELKSAGAQLRFDHTEQGLLPPFDKYVVATDQNGNVYKFVVPAAKRGSDSDIASWFATL